MECIIPLVEGAFREQLMQNRLTVGWAGRSCEHYAGYQEKRK